jgi:hypothetical protein
MLYTIAVILLIAWLLGIVGTYTIGAFVHGLLVVTVVLFVLFVVGLLSGRRRSYSGAESTCQGDPAGRSTPARGGIGTASRIARGWLMALGQRSYDGCVARCLSGGLSPICHRIWMLKGHLS